jgi:hypothetical protein
MYRYPGAGHMIEPPFAPHPRAVTPGRKRMQSINFVPEKFHGMYSKNLHVMFICLL